MFLFWPSLFLIFFFYSTLLGISAHENVHDYKASDPASNVRAEDISKIQSNIVLDNFLYNKALEIAIARIGHVERKTGIKIMCDKYKDSLLNYVWKSIDVVEKITNLAD